MSDRRKVFAIAARRFNKRIFGEQTSYLRGLIRIAKRYNMDGYVFSPLDIDWEKRRIKAYVPTNRGWKKVRRGFPHVVHDRVWGLGPEKTAESKAALRRLEDEFGVVVFNPDFGDKLDVHALLSQDPDLSPHLPRTVPASVEDIERLGKLHRTLYLKPVRGRQGKGIVKAERTGEGWKASKQTDSGSTVKRNLKDASALLTFAAGADPGAYLVQQGLDLIRAGRSAVDIRAIVQKDKSGRWQVSAIGARVGRPGGFVSNLHAGGTAMTLPMLTRRLSRSPGAKSLAIRVKALALKSAIQMSTAFPTLGELGLDFGLDRTGKLWIIEVNRQPGRALFSRARLRKSWRRSRVRVVQYARHLCAGEGARDGTESSSLPPGN